MLTFGQMRDARNGLDTDADEDDDAAVSDTSESRLFGIEMECEGVRSTSYGPMSRLHEAGWEGVGDGSLRNSGVEFVSPPVTYQAACDMLQVLYQVKDEYHYRSSVRTSMHVHVNMRAETFDTLNNVLAAYCIVEPLLFLLCGPAREENIYCVPFYRANAPLRQLGRLKAGRRGWSEVCKYSALNIASLNKFGTLEFRHAPLWYTVGDAIQWVGIAGELVEQGLKYSPATLLAALKQGGAESVVRMLLPVHGAALIALYAQCEAHAHGTTLAEWLLEHDVVSSIAIIEPTSIGADAIPHNFMWKFENLHSARKPNAALAPLSGRLTTEIALGNYEITGPPDSEEEYGWITPSPEDESDTPIEDRF